MKDFRQQRILWDSFAPPDLFITTPVDPARIKGFQGRFGGSWLASLNIKKYENCSVIVDQGFNMLMNIMKWNIQRLGVVNQAVVVSSQGIERQAGRWKQNELMTALRKFNDALLEGSRDIDSGDESHLPSYRWLQWIIFLVLKEAALLAMIKRDCETILGMWNTKLEDKGALFISSMISRMWYLASVMVEELNSKIYPFLFKLTNVIHKVDCSDDWPDWHCSYKVPNPEGGFLNWIQETFNIAFEPAYNNNTLLSLVKKDNVRIIRLLEDKDHDSCTISSAAENPDSKLIEKLVQAIVKLYEESLRARAGSSNNIVDPGVQNITITNQPVVSQPAQPSDFVPLQSIPMMNSGNAEKTGGRRDEGPLPPAKRIKIQDSRSGTSNRVHADEKENEPINFYQFNEVGKVNSVSAFELYFKLFFQGLNPRTQAGRQDVLRRIKLCKCPPSKLFSFNFREMMRMLWTDLTDLGLLVAQYNPKVKSKFRLRYDQFLSDFEVRLSMIGTEAKKLVELEKLKNEQQQGNTQQRPPMASAAEGQGR